MNLEKFKTVFLSGKGGVGKSTLSSSLGIYYAERGHRTLVVSLDPAHSLSLTFNIPVGGKPKRIAENLYAVEIDPRKEARKYLERVKREARELLSPVVIGEIEKQIELAYYSPGALDLATADVIYKLAVLEREFDRIVFDTAPSGYTVRVLTSPELTQEWLRRLISLRKEAIKYRKMAGKDSLEDPVIKILRRRLKEAEELRNLFLSGRTLMAVVVNPQTLPVEIGKRTAEELNQAGIRIGLVLGNRVSTPEEKNFVERSFPGIPKVFIPVFKGEPTGIEALKRIAEKL